MRAARRAQALAVLCGLSGCFGNPPVTEATVRKYEECPTGPGQELQAQGSRLIAAGAPAEAVPLLERALRHCPDNVLLHIAFQDAALAAGMAERAAAFYAGSEDRSTDAVAIYARARLEPDPDQALRLLDRCLEVDPRFYFAWLAKGRLLRSAARLPEATAALERALGQNPALSAADLELAEIKEETGEPQLAAIHYRRYLAANPQNRVVRENFVRLIVQIGKDVDEALPILVRLLEEDPDAKNLLLLKAAILWRSGDLAGAREAYREVLRDDATASRAVLSLGNLYLEGFRDLSLARVCYLHFLRLPTAAGTTDMIDRLFTVPYRLREIDQAIGPHRGALPPITDL